jgi:hypothetical protein
MRGTFLCLKGKHEDALNDLTKSIELDPSMTQSYIKRASMNLELGMFSTIQIEFIVVTDEVSRSSRDCCRGLRPCPGAECERSRHLLPPGAAAFHQGRVL